MCIYIIETCTHACTCTYRRLGTFVASKDLPDGVNEGLLLWLNKVSEAAIQAEINERGRAVQVSDARQRRRNRLQLMGAVEPCIRHVDNICVGVGEGQALAALLIHYVPQSFKWAGWFRLLRLIPCDRLFMRA